MIKNYGYIKPKFEVEHFVLGGLASLPKTILQIDGQWDAYLPVYEPQIGGSWDTFGCTVWATENAIEILLKKVFGVEANFSERFIYNLVPVRPPGDDPHKIAEAIRDYGLVDQDVLPMTSRFDEFIVPTPMTDEYISMGEQWLFKYDFGHEWLWKVTQDKEERISKMKEALRYSPLGVSVTAWNKGNDGVYVDKGQPNTHWTVCYGWDDNKGAWKIFDSYDQSLKLYSYDSQIDCAKRFLLAPSTRKAQLSILQQIINLLRIWTNTVKPVPVFIPEPEPAPVVVEEVKGKKLESFCLAIRDYEGSPGDLNYRNNNPGNCKYSPVGYAAIYGLVRKDARGFAIFKDYATGWLYLKNFVISKAKKNPEQSLLDFMKIYAPTADSNNPEAYASYIAMRMGVDKYTFKIKELLS